MIPRAPNDPFASAFQSLKWADQGIGEIDAAARIFFENCFYRIWNERDPDTHEQLTKVRVYSVVSDNIVRKTAEANRNIKDSFDRALFGARQALSEKTNKTVTFPWAQDPDDLEKRLQNRLIEPATHSVIRQFEPFFRGAGYEGGDNVIRTLAQLGGKAKHTYDLVPVPNIEKSKPPSMRAPARKQRVRLGAPEILWGEKEVIILRAPPDALVGNNDEVGVSLAFGEFGPLYRLAVVPALRYFHMYAFAFVEAIKQAVTETQ